VLAPVAGTWQASREETSHAAMLIVENWESGIFLNTKFNEWVNFGC
jgi:hypothetical protein